MFDRVYLINLKRRPDRLAAFRNMQADNGWQLPEPIIFEAIEGDKVGVPDYFKQGGGAYGCLRSHVTCLERVLMDDLETVLMMEDDCTWFPDAWQRLKAFMQSVPEDYQQVMLGGQHTQPPVPVKPGVLRCRNTQRTHAYAIKASAIKSLLKVWSTSGVHIDWVMGPWQADKAVYCPSSFIFGQAGGKSDISGQTNPPKFWIPPGEMPVIFLTAPPEVVMKLRSFGFHTGYSRDSEGFDKGLQAVVKTYDKPKALRRWLDTIQWECASDLGTVATIWHPDITADLVKQVSNNVIEVTGETVEECLACVSGLNLKKNLSATHVLVLRASREVADNLPGFHRGFWCDPVTGQDNGQREAAVARDKPSRLRKWLSQVAPEAERIGAVPLVWHDGISLADVQACTDRKVIEITASSVDDVKRQWKAAV